MITPYIQVAKKHPLLTVDETNALALRARAGDKRAHDKLVVSNLRFVVKIAHEYRRYGDKLTDLVQEGNIGLIRAVAKYDPAREIRLTTYAAWWIHAYIKQYVMRDWSLVKIGGNRADRALFFAMPRILRTLHRELGHPPTDEEIALRYGYSTKVITTLRQRMDQSDYSLDYFSADEEGISGESLRDSIATNGPTPEDSCIDSQFASYATETVKGALTHLRYLDRQVITMRKLRDPPMLLQEIGEVLGMSRERVRQIEKRALTKLTEVVECNTRLAG